MNRTFLSRFCGLGTLAFTAVLVAGPGLAADYLRGRVMAGGGPIAGSTITVWEESANAPRKLAETKSGQDGRFDVRGLAHGDSVLYLVAAAGQANAGKGKGENQAIALLTVLGSKPPASVVINEFTTVASVWTHAQFLEGTSIKGQALGLRIAAGNVPNFVNLETGGWGEAVIGPLNGPQTPTMANFATLASLLSGCITRVKANACESLFAAATPPTGETPTNTLAAAWSVARYPWFRPERLFALLSEFYPVSKGKNLRPVPFMPYLNYPPSAWVLPLKFDGGGYRAGGKAMFDSEGNLWVGDNWTVGWQGQDALWQGNVTKFAPNGRPLSPSPAGFTGGGMEGGTFGAAIDAKDNAWFTNYGSKCIAVFDKHGKPLTPPDGINFNGRLGLMQGVIVTPGGDVWVLGIEKSQLVHFPKGDLTSGRIVCEGESAEPCKSFRAPFHLGIDHQDRIWVSNSGIDHVTRFPATDPGKAENFKAGFNSSGLAIDSQGNVWVTNRFGSGLLGAAHLVDMGVRLKLDGVTAASDYLTKTMSTQKGGSEGGSVTLLRPDGTQFTGSPFTGGSIPGPWAVVVDGNDNVWVSNFAGVAGQIAHLCGTRTENCPPGMKTGDQISPPLGYMGGGLQMMTDIAVDPAGNVWAINNWQDIDSCVGTPNEALSTRCGGQGVTIFYGMAKPVQAPQIGPARRP
jgi:hypothetical protein